MGTQVRTALVALDMAGVGLVAGGAYGSRATCSGPAPGCDIKYSYLAASGRDLDAAPLEKKRWVLPPPPPRLLQQAQTGHGA